MGELFAIAVSIVIAGVLWFHVIRPILEDYGVISTGEGVNTSGAEITSSAREDAIESAPPSLQTEVRRDQDQTDDPKARRAKLLDTYRALRKLGMSRDDARALLKPWGIPLDNNLWTQAAPPPEEPVSLTPIAGRPTSAEFRDPELTYQPPPR